MQVNSTSEHNSTINDLENKLKEIEITSHIPIRSSIKKDLFITTTIRPTIKVFLCVNNCGLRGILWFFLKEFN